MFTRFNKVSPIAFPVAMAAAALGSAYFFSTSKIIHNESPRKTTFKGGDEWVDLKLRNKVKVSPDTHHYYFFLNSPEDYSGMEVASCMMAKYVTAKGNNVVRPYTPISDVDEKGILEFCIKTYPDGKFGNYLANLKEGETVSFKGPIVKFKWEPNSFKEIALIGGGSGITPLFQLANQINRNPEDKTKVKLFYGNKTKDDILIKKELDDLAQKSQGQIEIHYFLDTPPSDWDGKTGFITKDFLKENLAGPDADTKIYVCGPPPLYDAISGQKVSPQDQGNLSGALAELGYKKEQVFKY